ncbi:hypothetical protein [Acidimangrovimonas pyrenivorans]|uniref:Uncharacterized protein n=1 Tax=Acidimangrovimonas pyrenivorans TaxID=2030798 RepID=A0ABV7ANI3_9RHOB
MTPKLLSIQAIAPIVRAALITHPGTANGAQSESLRACIPEGLPGLQAKPHKFKRTGRQIAA